MQERVAKDKQAIRPLPLLFSRPLSTLAETPRQGIRGPSSPGSRLLGPPPPLAGPLSAQHRSFSHNESLSSSSTSSALTSTTSRTTLEAITKELARRQAADANNIGSAGGAGGRGRNYSNCSSTGTGGWSVGSSSGDGGGCGGTSVRSARATSVGSASAAEATTPPAAGAGGVDGSSLISENNGRDGVAVGVEKKGGGEGIGVRSKSLPGKPSRTGGQEEAGVEEEENQVTAGVNSSAVIGGYSSNNNGGKNNDKKKNQGKDRGPGGLVGLVEGEEEEEEEAAVAAEAAASDHHHSSGVRESALEDHCVLPFPFEEEDVTPPEQSDDALTAHHTGQIEPCSESGTADDAAHQATDTGPPGSAREWKYPQEAATATDVVGVGGVARRTVDGASAMGEEGSLRVKTSSWRGDLKDESATAVEAVSGKGSVEDGRSGRRRGCGEGFSTFERTSMSVCVVYFHCRLCSAFSCSSLSCTTLSISSPQHARVEQSYQPRYRPCSYSNTTKFEQEGEKGPAPPLGETEQSLPWAAVSAGAGRDSGGRGREFTKREPHEKVRTRSRSHSMAEVGGES